MAFAKFHNSWVVKMNVVDEQFLWCEFKMSLYCLRSTTELYGYGQLQLPKIENNV